MSPTPRYQSRLFQTVRSQVRNIKDSTQLRWRQFKVAATWGAQAALYPLYTLFQAARWGGQVLQQAATTGTQALLSFARGEQPAPTDQPIQNVLNAIDCLELPMGNATPKPLQLSIRPVAKPKSVLAVWRKKLSHLWQPWRKAQSPAPMSDLSLCASVAMQPSGQSNVVSQSIAIRGVASLLVQQRLVLVTADNQILDVLTVDQQRQLHQRIIWEIAQALYSRRQLGRARRAIPGWKTWQTLPIKPRPQYSFPVRAIYHLMAWVQQQPIAHVVQPLLLSQNVQKAPLALTGQTPTRPVLSAIAHKLRGYRTILVAVAGAIALLPFTFAMPEPAKAAMVPTLPAPLPNPLVVEQLMDPGRLRRRWQAEAKISEQCSSPSQGKVRLAPQKTAAKLSVPHFEGPIADWANRFSQTTKAKDPSTIEVDAVFMGYDHHPLEVLLLWLDRAIAWIEAQLVNIWGWFLPRLQNWMGQYWHR